MPNACWWPIDMTGGDAEQPGRGTGLVDEMVRIVNCDVARSGNRVRTVTADYALAAARAHFTAAGRDRIEIRTVLQDWPFEMKRKLAVRYHCLFWTMQQLDNEANSCKPGQLPMTVGTRDCPSFAENFNACFVMGIPTREGRFPFTAWKHCRASEHGPIVLTFP